MFYPPSKTSVETIRRYGELAALGCDPGVAARAWSDSGSTTPMTARCDGRGRLSRHPQAGPPQSELVRANEVSLLKFTVHSAVRSEPGAWDRVASTERVVRTTLAVATGAVIAKAREWWCITILTSFLGRDNHEGVLPASQDERRDHQAVR